MPVVAVPTIIVAAAAKYHGGNLCRIVHKGIFLKARDVHDFYSLNGMRENFLQKVFPHPFKNFTFL